MSENKTSDGLWAPWWVYVVIIAGANLVKQKFLEGMPVVVNLAATVVLVAVLFVVITAVFRGLRPTGHRQG